MLSALDAEGPGTIMTTQEKLLTMVPMIERPDTETRGQDPLAAFTGILWGSMLGSAIWLTVLAILLTS